ncbi:NHLP-related RiPP peptide [Stenotrophomonas maltophilia]|nr:NHLP-related RiPP peptide [Stenotrophomonas maltophilia]MBH1846067.1 NHLP-related RiPP peptide [Stenotrophomonas maltophilia]
MTNRKSPLSLADATTLLDLLTTDADFRTAFKQDPATALQQISAEAGAAAQGCMLSADLASNEDLAAARDSLVQQLTERAVFSHPHCFIDGSQAPTP